MAHIGGRIKGTADQSEILAAEEAGWTELHSLIDQLTPEQALRSGYYAEGWSAKDLLAHLGAWLAEAGLMLERSRPAPTDARRSTSMA